MAVGLTFPDVMFPVDGIRLASTAAGLKKNGADDMVLLACDPGTRAAAVFTQNAFCAAPVTVAKNHLNSSYPRYLLINSGNANAGTGNMGHENALACCRRIAETADIDVTEVLPFSTGVIGQQLDMPILERGIDQLLISTDAEGWGRAARGIMTTDTVPKGFSERILVDGVEVTISGIAKGSGMICPNMATILAFVATDACVCKESLQELLESANARSFNSITVDGDTSTNDALVALASGKAGNSELNASHPEWKHFVDHIQHACNVLAQSIVRDGEGATKFLEVNVKNGRSVEECREVAYTVAHSPLIKTAFYASDPNVGRLLAAVGRSNIDSLDISTISIAIDETPIVDRGEPSATYTEEDGQRVMDREEITIFIDLGRGSSSWSIWTTDLSHGYVTINAEYRT